MAYGPWQLTANAVENMLNGTHDIDSDSYVIVLVDGTSNISGTSDTMAALTGELANANGYTTGGKPVTLQIVKNSVTASGTTTTTTSVRLATNPTWTATGGTLTARRAVLGEAGGKVIARCLLDAANVDVSATVSQTITIDSDGTPSNLIDFPTVTATS